MTPSKHECEHIFGECFLAGETVPPGLYRIIGTNKLIDLHEEGQLPASLDGHVACFESVNYMWHQLTKRPSFREPLPIDADPHAGFEHSHRRE
jgi:hypothetical protein